MQIGNELVNILISGGGTGGHFFPAYSLMEHLKTKKYKVTLTTDERCKKYFLKEHYKDEIEVLEVARLGFSPKKFICFIFSLIGNIVTNIKFGDKCTQKFTVHNGHCGFQILDIWKAPSHEQCLISVSVPIHWQGLLSTHTRS